LSIIKKSNYTSNAILPNPSHYAEETFPLPERDIYPEAR